MGDRACCANSFLEEIQKAQIFSPELFLFPLLFQSFYGFRFSSIHFTNPNRLAGELICQILLSAYVLHGPVHFIAAVQPVEVVQSVPFLGGEWQAWGGTVVRWLAVFPHTFGTWSLPWLNVYGVCMFFPYHLGVSSKWCYSPSPKNMPGLIGVIKLFVGVCLCV